MSGYVKIYRKIKEWEWRTCPNTFSVFMHLVAEANHKDGKWRGVPVKRGQLITSLNAINNCTGVSIRGVRTALSRLEKTGEISLKSTNKNTLVTIENYSAFQECDTRNDKRATNKRQASDNKQEGKNDKNKKLKIKKPENVSEQTWEDFIEHRDRQDHPLTQTALTRIINQAQEANWSLEDALQEIYSRDWRGFSASWVEKRKKSTAINGMEVQL